MFVVGFLICFLAGVDPVRIDVDRLREGVCSGRECLATGLAGQETDSALLIAAIRCRRAEC